MMHTITKHVGNGNVVKDNIIKMICANDFNATIIINASITVITFPDFYECLFCINNEFEMMLTGDYSTIRIYTMTGIVTIQ